MLIVELAGTVTLPVTCVQLTVAGALFWFGILHVKVALSTPPMRSQKVMLVKVVIVRLLLPDRATETSMVLIVTACATVMVLAVAVVEKSVVVELIVP